MQSEVAVTEREPGGASELGNGVESLPRLPEAAPPALLVGKPGERVQDAVEVGRDVETEDLEVVRHVAYDGNVDWIDNTDEPTEKPRSADAA